MCTTCRLYRNKNGNVKFEITALLEISNLKQCSSDDIRKMSPIFVRSPRKSECTFFHIRLYIKFQVYQPSPPPSSLVL